MREIKFRAWNKKYDIMSYCWEWEYDTDTIWQILDCFPQEHIMQYTWLKDKNWKEIYEGDIVIASWWRNKSLVKYEIYWYQPFMFWRWDWYNSFSDIEVIWNICENPELLK